MARTSGTYRQMQVVLDSIEASNEQTRQTMAAVENAMNILANFGGANATPVVGPNAGSYGVGSNGLPNGGRPTMSQNQTQRPRMAYDRQQIDHSQGFGGQGGRGIGGIRNAAARAINRNMGVGSGPVYSRVTDQTTGELVGYQAQHPNGTIENFTPQWGESEAGQAALAGAASRAGTSSMLGALGEGGLMAGARAIPYVGAAMMGVEALHEGATFISDQRAANAQYQNVLGGDNFSGFGQRFDQAGFQIGQLFGGGLGWGQSQQAFQGVTALGYQGDTRSKDLGFITQNYMSMGVSVADSLKLIQTAASDLNESLSGLQSGLKSTRDAAIATGQSGAVGNAMFQNAYAQMSQQYAGAGVAQVSGVLSTVQAGMGRYMTNVDLTKMLTDPGRIPMLARSVGMTPTQFIGAVQSGNMSVFHAVDKALGRAAAPTLNNSSNQQIIQSYVRNNLSNGTGNYLRGVAHLKAEKDPTDDLQAMADRLMNSKGFNVQALQAQMQATTGLSLTYDQATMLALREQLDLTNTTKAAQAMQSRSNMGAAVTTPNTTSRADTERGISRQTIDASRSGVNPTIDALKKKYSDTTQFVVQDGKLGKRVVSLKVAEQDYADQLATGTARLASDNRSVKDIMDGKVQGHYDYASDYYKKFGKSTPHDQITYSNLIDHNTAKYGSSASDARGQSIADYRNQVNKSDAQTLGAKGKLGTVTIAPAPELLSLLNFNVSGNVNLATQAAQAGAMPTPGQ